MSLEANRGKRGGYRPGAGRKKGVPADASMTSLNQQRPNASMFEISAEVVRYFRARGVIEKKAGHIKAADKLLEKAAALAVKLVQYEKGKMQSVVLSGPDEGPVQHTIKVQYVEPVRKG